MSRWTSQNVIKLARHAFIGMALGFTVPGLGRAVEDANPSASVPATAEESAPASLRTLLSELIGAGKGVTRLLPLGSGASARKNVADESILAPAQEQAAEEKETPRPFIPNTMVEGRLTTRQDLGFEMHRMTRETAGLAQARAGAPSETLQMIFKASQREVAEQKALLARKDPVSKGQVLGRGAPWNPEAVPSVSESTSPVPPSANRGFLLALVEPRGARNRTRSLESVEDGQEKPRRFALLLQPRRSRPPRSSPDPEPVSSPPSPRKPTAAPYMTVESMGAPFHVFDEEPGDPFLIELEGNAIARVREQGNEWAWLQLDSGLMGVIRNKYLRRASEDEITAFLVREGRDPSALEELIRNYDIGVIDLDARGLPLESVAGSVAPSPRVMPVETDPAPVGVTEWQENLE